MSLNGFIKIGNCENLEELEQEERTFECKKDYEAKIQAIEEELLSLGNGRSLQDLIVEADSIEHDSIQVDLEEIQHELDEIEPKRSQLEQAHGVVKKEFEGKNTRY